MSAPVFPGQSPGRSKGAIDAQRGRIELDVVRVGSGAETQSIIVALIEHAERGNLAACVPADRERVRSEPSRGTQLAGDAAGHHTRERGGFSRSVSPWRRVPGTVNATHSAWPSIGKISP